MSASLVVLIPLALLAIVLVLGFVGCGLDESGTGNPPFTKYTDNTVLANAAVVAYWPLSETADTDPAVDRKGGNNGKYVDATTAPSLYPWPAYPIANPPGPDIQSAAAPGTLALGQPGIVNGDLVQPANTDRTRCVVVNGAYVEVPFNAAFNPPTSFTVEAWVRVDWAKSDPHAFRAVLDSRESAGGQKGFALYAKADDGQPGVYHWEVVIGNGASGSAGLTLATSDDPPIALNDPSLPAGVTYYLAVTYDGPSQTLTLYVDGEQRAPKVSPATYVPNATQPLWIGAGLPFVPRRPQPPGTLASPLFPFVGAIQDVAVYNAALASDVILKHYHNGNGTDP
jgi:hypothetical protein